jgi:cation diffusion facilitator family transporter
MNEQQHVSRLDPRVKAARVSVLSNTILVALKLIVGVLIGSVSVISEAIHSALDLAAALIAFFSLKKAAKPADEHHQYGHGKIENISGLIEGLLIFFAAIWIIFEAYKKLISGAHVEGIGLGMAVMAGAATINYLVSRYLFRVAEATDSIALKADALHLSTDVVTSAGVMVGLGLIKLTGIELLDPLVAVAVALLILKASFELTKEAFLPLLDVKLPEEEERAIVEIIQRHEANYVEFHKLRSRKAGAERHIDLHLVVPENRHISDIHHMCDQIEQEIKERFPTSHVLIHAEPCDQVCVQCTSQGLCSDRDQVKKLLQRKN